MYDLDPLDQKRGWIWLFCASAFGALLVWFLPWIDRKLSESTFEKDKSVYMRELRVAQASVGSGVVDPRSR